MEKKTLADFIATVAYGYQIEVTDLPRLTSLLRADLPGVLTRVETKLNSLSAGNVTEDTINGAKDEILDGLSDLVTKDKLSEKLAALKDEIDGSLEAFVTDKLKLQLESLAGTCGDIKDMLSETSGDLTASVEQLSSANEALQQAVATVEQNLSASVQNTQDALANLVRQQTTDMQQAMVVLQNGLASAVRDTKDSLSQILSEVQEDLSGKLDEILRDFTNELSETETTLKSSVSDVRTTLSESINDVKQQCENMIADLNALVANIENSTTIKDIQTKVSSFYDCYGRLLAQLTDLQTHCVITYKEWVQNAEMAATSHLELADKLEAVSTRMENLSDHERQLDFIIAQFDKLNQIAATINTLNAHWESDHATIEKFNEIVKSQKTFDNSKLAANIGTLLSGAADAALATKNLTQKETRSY